MLAKRSVLVLGFIAILSLTACGGGDTEVKNDYHTTTKGQQLLDLKKAQEAGAISKDEYEKERTKILNSN